jgi:hypothetical protein
MDKLLEQYFGSDLASKENRKRYYGFIEDFMVLNIESWDTPPDTELHAENFSKELKKLTDQELAFLVCISGYIPEYYGHDSSQETLYTKLIEVLVCEWALRIGFSDAEIQKQKGSKEDVTLMKNNSVIVCDAKSYRLGRSQAAPNVKDTIKKSDFQKWLSDYPSDHRVGGLITFPRLHNWKRASDAYLYCTDKDDPIMLLFYDQMALMLLGGDSSDYFLEAYEKYGDFYASPNKDQLLYFQALEKYFFEDEDINFRQFKRVTFHLLREKVAWAVDVCEKLLADTKVSIQAHAKKIDPAKLIEEYISMRYELENKEVIRQLGNIKKFRKV